MESVAFIQWCLDHLNYWTITLLMAIESSFIPFLGSGSAARRL